MKSKAPSFIKWPITLFTACFALAIALAVVGCATEKSGRALAQQTIDTRIGHGAATAHSVRFDELADLPFPGGAPTAETAQTLKDELLFQRGTQIYIWGMPLIMNLGMEVNSEKAFGAGYNVLPIWKQLTDGKTRITTPNTVTMYALNYLDLGKDGPLVMDLPPAPGGDQCNPVKPTFPRGTPSFRVDRLRRSGECVARFGPRHSGLAAIARTSASSWGFIGRSMEGYPWEKAPPGL